MSKYVINYPTKDGSNAHAEVDTNADLFEVLASIKSSGNSVDFEAVKIFDVSSEAATKSPNLSGTASAGMTDSSTTDPNTAAAGEGEAANNNGEEKEDDAA